MFLSLPTVSISLHLLSFSRSPPPAIPTTLSDGDPRALGLFEPVAIYELARCGGGRGKKKERKATAGTIEGF